MLSEDSFFGAGLRGTIIYINPSLFGIIIHIEKRRIKTAAVRGRSDFRAGFGQSARASWFWQYGGCDGHYSGR